MKLRGIIDRFEAEYAVIEVGENTMDMKRVLLPVEAKPGDTIIIDGEKITIDKQDTQKRKEQIEQLTNDLWED